MMWLGREGEQHRPGKLQDPNAGGRIGARKGEEPYILGAVSNSQSRLVEDGQLWGRLHFILQVEGSHWRHLSR